ncbi:GNAT family N-acetyltransferase [Legionella sp. CNM-1927-20]|uniref:GNAT family N-acetyltransferase n=1 Tax=Legionella sp. CNM-1927-20 TaxID=3422221 RepID=UPI00403AB291
MSYTINFTDQPSAKEIEIIHGGLERHAKQTIGITSFEPFGFMAHDNSGDLIAGCTGVLMYGVLYIKLLWVAETERGKGLGRQLIEKAESFAKRNNCRYITVDTFDWQAKSFYEKMEYKIEHFYNGYEGDSKFYFFRKKLE